MLMPDGEVTMPGWLQTPSRKASWGTSPAVLGAALTCQRVTAGCNLFAEVELGAFAGGGVGKFVHEEDVVGKLPFLEAVGENLVDALEIGGLAGAEDHDQDRPLTPFWVRDADGGGLGDACGSEAGPASSRRATTRHRLHRRP